MTAVRALKRLAVGVVLVAAALAVLLLVVLLPGRKNVVLIDNAFAFPVTVTVAGHAPVTVAAGRYHALEVDQGTWRLSASGPEGVVEEGTFAVPEREDPLIGFRGLYNLGGNAKYVLVSMCYGGSNCDHGIDRVGDGLRFFAIPRKVVGELDEAFPSAAPGSGVAARVHLCHAGATKDDVGCAGAH
jgi:hypothetical protein